MIYLNTLPRYGEIQYAGKNTCISGVWSVGVIILMCSGALRSAPERSGVGSERSEGVGNTGWWKNHMYQWGLERRSDNIDVLRSAPERSGALRSSSGVGSERSGAPELRSGAGALRSGSGDSGV